MKLLKATGSKLPNAFPTQLEMVSLSSATASTYHVHLDTCMTGRNMHFPHIKLRIASCHIQESCVFEERNKQASKQASKQAGNQTNMQALFICNACWLMTNFLTRLSLKQEEVLGSIKALIVWPLSTSTSY